MNKFVICEKCRNNDETCSLCEECKSGSNFERAGIVPANKDYCSPIVKDLLFDDNSPSPKASVLDDYSDKSYVSKHKARVKELVIDHWGYVEKVMTIGADKSRMFSFAEVMEMREFDFTSAAAHFYGHGFEDGELS